MSYNTLADTLVGALPSLHSTGYETSDTNELPFLFLKGLVWDGFAQLVSILRLTTPLHRRMIMQRSSIRLCLSGACSGQPDQKS